MSRHLLPAPDGAPPGTETVVGWDRPMGTYYLQINPPGGSTAAPVWLGADFHEIPDPDDFLGAVEAHGIGVSEDLMVELFLDRALGRSNVVTDWRTGRPVQIAP